MSRIFDMGNAFLNQLVKDLLDVQPNDHILEIGFGTGKLLHELSGELKDGRIEGIDFSETMVRIATRRNRKRIQSGCVNLIEGSFDKKQFGVNSFDKVCCTNTVYFWPDLERMLTDIGEVIKQGGLLLLAFEDAEQLQERPLDADVFRIHTASEIKEAAIGTGLFQNVEIVSRTKRKLIFHCLKAEKN